MTKLPPCGSTVMVRGSTHTYIVEGYISTFPFVRDVFDVSVRCGNTIRVVPLSDLKGVKSV